MAGKSMPFIDSTKAEAKIENINRRKTRIKVGYKPIDSFV